MGGGKERDNLIFQNDYGIEEVEGMKRLQLLILVLFFTVLVFMVQPIMAREMTLFGNPLSLYGYLTQGVSYSLRNDTHYDTEGDLQSLLTNLFMEAKYLPCKDWQFLISTRLSADWIYQLKRDDRSWNDRLFAESRSHLNFDNKYWEVLNEVHLSYTSAKTMLRVGKQVVKWGQTDGFRLMDQINPQDGRRGMSDVKFENSIIPIWLIRGEYAEQVQMNWLTEIGVQFIFNPNAKFIPNQAIEVGNDKGGIWAPNIEIPGPFPGGYAHLGSNNWDLKMPW